MAVRNPQIRGRNHETEGIWVQGGRPCGWGWRGSILVWPSVAVGIKIQNLLLLLIPTHTVSLSMRAPPRRLGVPPGATDIDIRRSTHDALVVVQHQRSLKEVSPRCSRVLRSHARLAKSAAGLAALAFD